MYKKVYVIKSNVFIYDYSSPCFKKTELCNLCQSLCSETKNKIFATVNWIQWTIIIMGSGWLGDEGEPRVGWVGVDGDPNTK